MSSGRQLAGRAADLRPRQPQGKHVVFAPLLSMPPQPHGACLHDETIPAIAVCLIAASSRSPDAPLCGPCRGRTRSAGRCSAASTGPSSAGTGTRCARRASLRSWPSGLVSWWVCHPSTCCGHCIGPDVYLWSFLAMVCSLSSIGGTPDAHSSHRSLIHANQRIAAMCERG